jgi:dipeptidyl aminopeptidase/acylaminoacyl peptidase
MSCKQYFQEKLVKLKFIFFLGAFMAIVSAETGYKLPQQNILNTFDSPRNPYISFVPFTNIGLELNYDQYSSLEDISEEKLSLAGVEFSPKLNAPKERYPVIMMIFHDFEKNEKKEVKLPENIRIRSYRFSMDYKKIAASYETAEGIQLMIIDVKTAEISYIQNVLLNDIFEDGGFSWLKDNKTIIAKVIPENRKKPNIGRIPESPVIEETSGKKSTMRTYTNLLKTTNDKILFEHYFTSQIALINTKNGKIRKITEPQIIDDISVSPDNKYLLIDTFHKPYSYQVPYYYFPRKICIIDLEGKEVKIIQERSLQDAIPIGGTYTGPRRCRWQPLKDASVIWAEALDDGDPKNKVEHRDKVMRQSSPFTAEPTEIFRTQHRFSGIDWSEAEDEMIIYEYDRDKLWRKGWLYDIGSLDAALVYDMSTGERYEHPGYLVHKRTANGEPVFIKQGNEVYYLNNRGSTPKGNFPYLARQNLITKEKEILFKCREGWHETVSCFIGKQADKIAISSQNKEIPSNYFFVDLETGDRKKITDYQNPYPEISGLEKELVKYTRADGIPLSGDLYLPVDYKEGTRVPLIISAYPQEFTSIATAGQTNSSPNTFTTLYGASIRYMALCGYAVLNRASIPIVGNPETVNETFIEQTVSSVEAAINYLDERRIIDTSRVGISGHSYGAFMVTNVLAHSNICAVGMAKSGAYNRTLTPFGFQSERRILWEAKDFYTKVSPFMHAEKINEPLLLIHGEDDPNSGTYPMQSRRMFQAIKGNNGTAKLVLLPFEGHGYSARESNLHVLAEMIEWFDKYLK